MLEYTLFNEETEEEEVVFATTLMSMLDKFPRFKSEPGWYIDRVEFID